MRRLEIIKGQIFGRFTVIKESVPYILPKSKKPCRKVLCICSCGKEVDVLLSVLRNGRSRSCGCYMKEVNAERIKKQSVTHGNTPVGYNEYKSLYFVWNTIKQRCYNPKSTKYYNYGALGIKVCDEWLKDFIKFRDWSIENGYYKQPKNTPFKDKLSIDRKSSKGDYTPENCRWITISENASRRHLKDY